MHATNDIALINNLGHPATTPADRPLREGWLQRHRQYCARAKQGNLDLVFLGDSLSQRWEGAPDIWQKHYGRRNAAQMGIDNDGTQQVLWRIDHGTLDGATPKLIVLLIGINNIGNDNAAAEDVRDGVVAILGRIRGKLPKTAVLVMGLLPYGRPNTNYGPTIAATNKLLRTLRSDRDNVHFLDIGQHLLVDGKVSSALQPDGAHLSPRGYAIYAESIEPTVRKLMGETT